MDLLSQIRELRAKATQGPLESIATSYGTHIEPSVAWMGNTTRHDRSETNANVALIVLLVNNLDAIEQALEATNGKA